MNVDTTSYNKANRTIGSGYDRRPKGYKPSSIVVHTTNGRRGSSLEAEARYLYTSNAVGAHDLIGQQGDIVQLLDALLRAWHAGVAMPAFINSRSIGIECHLTAGERWTKAQRDALTWRVRFYMDLFGIPVSNIDTHRAVALPHGRKSDPVAWPDAEFYAWRAELVGQLYVPQPPRLSTYLVTDEVNVRQGPTKETPVALGGHAVLPVGMTFQSDVVVAGQKLASGNQWIHMVTPAAWGFVHSSCVRLVVA